MKKLASLLTAALFALTAALPASAAPVDDDSLAIVPATAPIASGKHAKKVKAQKHKKIKKAKHQRVRAHKRKY